MDYYNIITPSSKFKHLSFQHYEFFVKTCFMTKEEAMKQALLSLIP